MRPLQQVTFRREFLRTLFAALTEEVLSGMKAS